MRYTALAALAALAGAACSDSSPTPDIQGPAQVQGQGAEEASPSSTRWYDVTIANLTTGQPLSPGVVLTHSKNLSLFEAGTAASDGIRFIAENGDPTTAAAELSGVVGVADLQTTSAPVGMVGGSAFPSSLTLRIGARGNANHLSLALMLICTNDGFTGLDGVQLPGGFDPVSWDTPAYDAGTEVNTEACLPASRSPRQRAPAAVATPARAASSPCIRESRAAARWCRRSTAGPAPSRGSPSSGSSSQVALRRGPPDSGGPLRRARRVRRIRPATA